MQNHETIAVQNRLRKESEPEESQSDDSQSGEDSQLEENELPDLSEYVVARQQLKSLNERRKALMDTLKRSADEVEDYLITSQRKKMRISGVICELKTTKYTPWNEKSMREHVDEDGKLNLETYKANATVTKQKLVMKVTK